MKEGTCILLVSGLRPFASKLFDLTKHPRYSELFEPWNADATKQNFYDHSKQRNLNKELKSQQRMMNELGLSFAKVVPFKMRDLTEYEINQMGNDILLSNKTITDDLLNNL